VRFSAAHFATIGGTCEPLHGHSYAVAAEIDGTLSEDAWVIDFTELRAILRRLCDELDHHFILQRDSSVLDLEQEGTEWRVRTPAGLAYTLPAADVVALPVDNSTAERLAQWLCHRLNKALDESGARNLHSVSLEVWEGPGQRASHRLKRLPLE
jgi:6-pyruvoyltetrahydropterin/6-carboxytetrahydropterin synthase